MDRMKWTKELNGIKNVMSISYLEKKRIDKIKWEVEWNNIWTIFAPCETQEWAKLNHIHYIWDANKGTKRTNNNV